MQFKPLQLKIDHEELTPDLSAKVADETMRKIAEKVAREVQTNIRQRRSWTGEPLAVLTKSTQEQKGILKTSPLQYSGQLLNSIKAKKISMGNYQVVSTGARTDRGYGRKIPKVSKYSSKEHKDKVGKIIKTNDELMTIHAEEGASKEKVVRDVFGIHPRSWVYGVNLINALVKNQLTKKRKSRTTNY